MFDNFNEVRDIPKWEVIPLLRQATINNPRASIKQFLLKLREENRFIGLFDIDNELVALGIIVVDRAGCKDYYLNGIQSLKKGTGKELINYFLDKYDNLWFMCDPSSSSELLDYYKNNFGDRLTEYQINSNIYNKNTHFFISNKFNADKNKLYNFIDDWYEKE